jgi:GTP-binding protein Era
MEIVQNNGNNINNGLQNNIEISQISVGFFGIPNSGKSSLINLLSGNDISIVSALPQTTQELTDSIIIKNNIRLCFIDTPGINFKKNGIRGFVNKVALSAIDRVMYHFIVIDCEKPVLPVIAGFDYSESFFVFTKIDKVPLSKLLLVAKTLSDQHQPKEVFYTSIKHLEKVQVLLEFLETLPTMKKIIEIEESTKKTTESMEKICNIKTKEQLFKLFKKEVPYNVLIKTISIEERERDIIINQTILVPRISYRKMILGDLLIKKIRENSAKSIQKVLNKKIHLYIKVTIEEVNLEVIVAANNKTDTRSWNE